MVRIFGFIVGLGFVGVLLISLFATVSDYLSAPQPQSAEHEFHKHAKAVSFPSDGPFGKFDEQQLQRGFQVFKEVCASCHGLEYVAFRDLEALGYSEAEVKAIADQWQIEVPSINQETGEDTTRKAIPADRFPNPYPNVVAARAANNNAFPPDLSLITKAREGGAAYIYSLLTGYQKQEGYKNEKGEVLLHQFPEAKTPEGLYFNPYFANLNLAMPPPLTAEGQVTYADGTKASVSRMAKDVSAFLVWTAEPNLQRRHAAGLAVTIFLLFATIFGYFAYRNVWATEKRKVRITGALDPENIAKTKRASRKAGVKP